MSTFFSLNCHVIFSTKYRKPWIRDSWIHRLHEYLGGTVRGLDALPLSVGGVADHVHLLLGLKTTHRLSDLMCELKKHSSAWVHETVNEKGFQWQEGYAAFTVSPTSCERVSRYIGRQAEHHKEVSFEVEIKALLRRAGVEFDPKFLK